MTGEFHNGLMFESIVAYMPWIWFGLAVVFTLIEVTTFNLVTIWFALGSLIMIFVSFLPIPIGWTVLIFLGISTLMLIFTRPIAEKKLKIGKAKTNTDALLGEKVVVIKPFSDFDKGEVKVKGISWSALAVKGASFQEGEKGIIEKVEGVTLYIKPLKEE